VFDVDNQARQHDRSATPRPGARTRVFVGDKHEVIRLGLQLLLNATEDLELVGSTDSAREVVRVAAEDDIDVLLVDVDLDGVMGRDLGPAIATTGTSARFCFLVDHLERSTAAELTRYGASGILHRRASGRHLVEALRRLPYEGLVVDPIMAEVLMSDLLVPSHEPELDGLNARDLELLRLLGEGRTNREIADAVFLSEKTVKNYLSRLFRKLGVRSRTEAALVSARIDPRPTTVGATAGLD
jgi:two-component system, NarL family, response regulator DevR